MASLEKINMEETTTNDVVADDAVVANDAADAADAEANEETAEESAEPTEATEETVA